MFFLLTAPVNDPKLAELNAQYLGDVNILLTAADWAQVPASQSTCSIDLNFDLIQDCVIANENFFAVLQSDGGRLSYLFSHDGKGVHQIIAPGWQFTTGLSDRLEWQSGLGSAADPSQIPGAFYNSDSPWRIYTPALNEEGGVTFTSSGEMVKTFFLTKAGVQFDFHGSPIMIKSGLALDPWHRIEPGWGEKYQAKVESDVLGWQLNGGPSVKLNVQNGSMVAFNDTLQYLSKLEDPNQAFPPGHFLPLPMVVLEFQAMDGYPTLLQIK